MFDLSLLDEHKVILSLFVWFLTAFWISFSGMLVWRLPVIFKVNFTDWTKDRTETTIMGRSHCDSCNRILTAKDLIPVLGWILNKGQCPACHSKVSIQWPLMEAIFATLAVGIFFIPIPFHDRIGLWLLFLWLTLLSWMDDKTTWLPDIFTFPVIFSGLIFSPLGTPMMRAEGALMGWCLFLISLSWLCWKRKSFEFMSWGDIILAAGAGAWLGWNHMVSYLFLTIFIGLIYVSVKKIMDSSTEYTEDGKMQIPFGPAMSCALIVNLILLEIFHIQMI